MITLFCLLIIGLLNTFQIQTIDISLLKGTHTILTGDQEYYSPVFGVPFNNNTAKGMYELSVKKLTTTVLKSIYLPPDQRKEVIKLPITGTEQLLFQLFTMVDDDFRLTNATNNPVRYFTTQTIGRILKVVYITEQYLAKSLKNKKQDELKTDLLEFYRSLEVTLKQSELDKKLKQFIGNKQQFIIEESKLFLRNYLTSLQLPKENNIYFQKSDFKPFINALFRSLAECSNLSKGNIYPQHTTQGLLLGYMLAKSETKRDLEQYFTEFTGQSISLPNDIYKQSNYAQPIVFGNVVKFADSYCQYILDNQQKFPTMSKDCHIPYYNNSFTDCVDTMMLNLCNIITYQNGTYGIMPDNIIAHPELQKFYNQNTAIQDHNVSHKTIHEKWVTIISNITGVSYNRVKKNNDSHDYAGISFSGSSQNLNSYAGFIPVQTFDKSLPTKTVKIDNTEYNLPIKKIGKNSYLLIPSDTNLVCYELMPEIRNTTILLNYLFNLGLYDNQEELLNKEDNKLFTTACQKTGLTVDKNMFNLSSSITLSKNNIRFNIHLSEKHHGYIKVDKPSRKTISISPNYLDQYPIQTSSCINLLDNETILNLASIEKHQCLLELAIQNDPNQILELQQNIVPRNDYTKNYTLPKIALYLSFNPDSYFLTNINYTLLDKNFIDYLLSLHKKKYTCYNYYSLLKTLYKQKVLQKKYLIDIINTDMAIPNSSQKERSISLAADLVKENILDQQFAHQILQTGLSDSYELTRIKCVDLVNNMITKDMLTPQEAFNTLQLIRNDTSKYVKQESIKIADTMLEKGILFEQTGIEIISSTNCYTDVSIIHLSKKMVEKGMLNKEFTTSLIRDKFFNISNETYGHEKQNLLELANAMIQRNILDAELGKNITLNAMNNPSWNVKRAALNLANAMVKKSLLDYQTATTIYQIGIADPDILVQDSAKDLKTTLNRFSLFKYKNKASAFAHTTYTMASIYLMQKRFHHTSAHDIKEDHEYLLPNYEPTLTSQRLSQQNKQIEESVNNFIKNFKVQEVSTPASSSVIPSFHLQQSQLPLMIARSKQSCLAGIRRIRYL